MERTCSRRFGKHPADRAILTLAVPALGALAADPLYSLADTAFVGRLGTPQLGAVAIGSAAFNASFWLFSFLAYGVTPRVARAYGAGNRDEAARLGMQALIMSVAIGIVVTTLGLLLAGPIVRVLGAQPEVEVFAVPYLRIRVLSATAVLIVQVGHGWLRGAQDTRTPMYIVIVTGAANLVLDYLLIYTAGWGVDGAAWSTVAGQWGAAIWFLLVLAPKLRGAVRRFQPEVARSLLKVGAELVVRTGALLAAMTLATSVASRMGVVPLGAWQITMQVFILLALTLDSVAIAAQAMIGRFLGARDPVTARDVGRRLMEWGLLVGVVLAVGLFVFRAPIARIFSRDERVVTEAAALLGWLALVQPLSAVAFTLDGLLIGASDTRFLAWSMLASSAIYGAVALAALGFGWGTAGLAAGATVWLVARSLTTGARWQRGRWALQP